MTVERLITKGYGKSRPRALHETESGRRQHRRIAVALLQPKTGPGGSARAEAGEEGDMTMGHAVC